MSESYDKKMSLEKRLEILENVIAKQDKKIQVLASFVSLSKVSPFSDPLKQFFDLADSYFDFFYETDVPCHNDCSERYRNAMKAAKGNPYDVAKARENLAACRADCGSILDS